MKILYDYPNIPFFQPGIKDMGNYKTYDDIKELLTKHRQSHLLAFWDQLDSVRKQELLEQIRGLDFRKIDRWIEDFIQKPASAPVSGDLKQADSYKPLPVDSKQTRKYADAIQLGKKLISDGKVAAFVVAGGQGTRLGFDGPKGNYPISPVKKKTLFRIFAETIAAVSKKYGAKCPWYVMTSPLNHIQTVEVFKDNNYYGLGKENVFIFQQGVLPNFSKDGRILLAEEGKLSCSPDGHGGSLTALAASGALNEMKKRGVEYISYWQVDNALINIFDPLFIGLHALDQAEMSSKALIKTGPKEKIGNFCLVDGKVNVIEYSDMPDDLAERQNPDGSLVFELGSIAIHIINRKFVEKLTSGDLSLPLHKAVKKIAHIDEKGNPVVSEGVKLESFVFDALPLASKSIILQTIREEEFAPAKNATGVDSAETARHMIVARAAAWLESAGVTVPRKTDGSVDCLLEIAPGFALDKDEVKAKLGQIPPITPGDEIYLA